MIYGRAGDETKLDDSTALAVDRTRLAIERTMLAWVRTAASLISFGFAVAKFSNILRPTSPESVARVFSAPQVGFVLVCIGIGSLVLAVNEHRKNIRDLGIHYASRRPSSAVMLAGVVALFGVLALTAMIVRP